MNDKTPFRRDPMLEGHVEMCGPEPHTSRVAAQVEQAQGPDANALWHWAEGLAGERARGPHAPSLAIPPLGALVFPVPVNLEPHEAGKHPLKGHVRVGRACNQGLIPCTALLEGVCQARHHCGLAGGRGIGP